MCEATAAQARAAGRAPRWGRLYGVIAMVASALAGLEYLVPAGPWRAGARAAVCAAAFGVMAVWVRRNRVALEQRDWCDCAATGIRVRVIPSRRADAGVLVGDAPDAGPRDDAPREHGRVVTGVQ